MNHQQRLSNFLVNESFTKARLSQRLRHAVVLHKRGDYFNEVYNFICRDSYMQPHMHPGAEKIEIIQVIRGSVAVFFFSNSGQVITRSLITPKAQDRIEVPAFMWHTYVMMSDEVITYETMQGIYDPPSWKTFADWAPREDSPAAKNYLQELRRFE